LLRSFELSEMFRLAESQAIGLSSLITLLPFRLLADGPKIDYLSHSLTSMVTSEFQFYVQVTPEPSLANAPIGWRKRAFTANFTRLNATLLGCLRAEFNAQLVDYKTRANESQ